MTPPTSAPKFRPYTRHTISTAPQWRQLDPALREATLVMARVLPFRTNAYVLDELIDWQRVPDDPIYRLCFGHPDMLPEPDYHRLRKLVLQQRDEAAIEQEVHRLRLAMNPHPGGQMTHNVPSLDGEPVPGIQHKYRETVLFFPSAGQSCHAYCSFCFRWPQFVGMQALKFSAPDTTQLVTYLRRHPEVSDVLITGGDPLVMGAAALARCIEPLLIPELSHVQNIRIGTKALAWWPHRFVSDPDADELLRLFERVAACGRHLALMVHLSHPAELRPAIAQQAMARLRATGATLRLQAPLVRHVNEAPEDWVELWSTGVRLGAIPYYLFIERDTGASDYFSLPLARAHAIFQAAYRSVSGLARTVRGPSMSTFAGKVLIDGIATLAGEPVFALQFLQARNADWVRRPFYARFDAAATWFDQLKPAFGEPRFFFEAEGRSSTAARIVPLRAEPREAARLTPGPH
ncbi:KamA family radical SAM protein [Eleftheria terrae]|uniref:KamA family radical SAM protein n=1 Tax=Eleftheria terrae TaxID=1597781 RepID=UPI00263A883B|nr:lysine 2,3-aminomutase [Eleftheria terrae]WKB51402.1 lysine 2,3-aminomutase [Eleftheria terrae]